MDGCHSFSNLSYGTGGFCCSELGDVLELHRFLSVKIWASVSLEPSLEPSLGSVCKRDCKCSPSCLVLCLQCHSLLTEVSSPQGSLKSASATLSWRPRCL